jgi:hypothetical protein
MGSKIAREVSLKTAIQGSRSAERSVIPDPLACYALAARSKFRKGPLWVQALNTYAKLRGEFATLQWWNPHAGTVSNAAYTTVTEANQSVTRVQLSLPPVKSVFLRGTATTSASDFKPGRSGVRSVR